MERPACVAADLHEVLATVQRRVRVERRGADVPREAAASRVLHSHPRSPQPSATDGGTPPRIHRELATGPPQLRLSRVGAAGRQLSATTLRRSGSASHEGDGKRRGRSRNRFLPTLYLTRRLGRSGTGTTPPRVWYTGQFVPIPAEQLDRCVPECRCGWYNRNGSFSSSCCSCPLSFGGDVEAMGNWISLGGAVRVHVTANHSVTQRASSGSRGLAGIGDRMFLRRRRAGIAESFRQCHGYGTGQQWIGARWRTGCGTRCGNGRRGMGGG